MARSVKWLGRALYALGIVGALAFGAQQALAARDAMDPCECPTPGQGGRQCAVCCPEYGGWCSYVYYCLCY